MEVHSSLCTERAEQRLQTFGLILLCTLTCSTNRRNNYRRQQSVENLNLARKSSTAYNKKVHTAHLEYKQKLLQNYAYCGRKTPKSIGKV